MRGTWTADKIRSLSPAGLDMLAHSLNGQAAAQDRLRDRGFGCVGTPVEESVELCLAYIDAHDGAQAAEGHET